MSWFTSLSVVKNRFLLTMLGLLLVLTLAACTANNDDSLPVYAGVKTVALSDDARKNLNLEEPISKGVKAEVYTTSDEASKVKTALVDALKSKGWTEDNTLFGTGADSLKVIENSGGFVLAYSKGDKGVGYIGFPGSFASLFNFKNVSQQDTLFIVISGEKTAIKS